MDVSLIALGLAALLALFAIAIYNKLVKRKNMVNEGWSGIDVQLKRRANLIPNLVETVKGYKIHEQNLLEKVVSLRTQTLSAEKPAAKGAAEGLLSAALGQLFAVAENYPDLKASQNFIELHKSLSEVEEQIQLARRYYNGAVRDMNILVESFPSNVIANIFKFALAEFFELEEPSERAVPGVSFN